MKADPLQLELRLQAFRMLAGRPDLREQLATRLASEGMTEADLELVLAHAEDRSRGEPQGLAHRILAEPHAWHRLVGDLRASFRWAGNREENVLAHDSDLSQGGARCVHGVAATRHCGACDSSGRNAAERLDAMRQAVAARRRGLPEHIRPAPNCRKPGSKVKVRGSGEVSFATFGDWAHEAFDRFRAMREAAPQPAAPTQARTPDSDDDRPIYGEPRRGGAR